MDLNKIQNILNRKNGYIDQQQEALERLLEKVGVKFLNDLQRIVAQGVFRVDVIAEALDASGWTKALDDLITPNGNALTELFAFSRELSTELGVNFLLSAQTQFEIEEFILAKQRNLIFKFRDAIAADMAEFALAGRLSQKPLEQLIAENRELLATEGRRAASEVATALNQYDRAVMSAVYREAGIDKFVYFPPTLIATSRDSCRKAVKDPRQQTGWTRAEIDAEPGLDFIQGGKPYYNCRHDWLPFLRPLGPREVGDGN